jgi:hypothetical protein
MANEFLTVVVMGVFGGIDKPFTDSALVSSPTTIVIPVLADVPQRVQGKRIEVWTDEVVTLNVPVLDEDGNSIDFTGRDFWFGVWDRSKTLQVETTAAGTSTGFEVTIPKLTQASSNMEWALRDSAASNTGIATGLFGVSLKPTAPAPP